MPLRTESKVIDGTKYTVRLLPTSETLAISSQLQKIILPILAAISEYNNFNRDTWVSEAVASYLVQMESTDLVDVCKILLYDTYINFDGDRTSKRSGSGQLVFNSKNYDDDFNFEVHFSGKLSLLVEVLAFAIEVNYPDVFSEASSLVALFKEQMKSSSRKEVELNQNGQEVVAGQKDEVQE